MLEGDSEVGVQFVGTVKVEIPQASLADGAHNIDVIASVTTLSVDIEVRANGAGGKAQSATLLESADVLSVDAVEVLDVCPCTCSLGLFGASATVTTGAKQAHSTQCRSTANQGAAAEAILSCFVATRGVCGVRGHGMASFFCSG